MENGLPHAPIKCLSKQMFQTRGFNIEANILQIKKMRFTISTWYPDW